MIDTKKLTHEFSNLGKEWIILLETSVDKVLEVSLTAAKILLNKKYHGIIVSTSRPSSNMLDIFNKQRINTNNILFLDCVSKTLGAGEKNVSNVLYLESVSDLTHISISINEGVKLMKGNKFVLIDSINTMLIHNQADIFTRFVHSILTRMRISKTNGILISLENETNKEVRAEIAQLCDKVIKV